MERTVTMRGKPLTLKGTALKVGDKAPDFNVVDNSLAKTGLASYKGKGSGHFGRAISGHSRVRCRNAPL